MKSFSEFTNRVGVDLGSSQIRIYVKNKGIILAENSAAVIDNASDMIVSFGTEALVRYHGAPEKYRLEWPMKSGVMADYHLTRDMLRYFLGKALHQSVSRPAVMMGIPSSLSSVGRHALIDAVLHAGARRVYLIHASAAAVLGAGMSLTLPAAIMSVVIGRDLTDCGLFTCGGVAAQEAIVFGGHTVDEGIRAYLHETYHMIIGSRAAEEIKTQVASAIKPKEERFIVVRGRRTTDGVEVVMELSARELYPVMQMILTPVVQLIKRVIRSASPEMAEDLLQNGILLSGGTALLTGISEWIAHEIGVPVMIARSPEDTVAAGCGIAMGEYRKYPHIIENGEQYYGGV